MIRCAAWWLVCGTLFAAEPPGVWLDVPFVRQQKDACGAASMAMLMQYWGDSAADAEQIRLALYSPRAHGIYSADMQRYLEQHGFRTFAFQGQWEDLKDHLEKGRPLIVALNSGHHNLHYVVVAGLDWQQEVVLKNDPAERKLLKQNRSSFEKQWKDAGNWTLLAVPQTGRTSP